jgi:hypothetical protein
LLVLNIIFEELWHYGSSRNIIWVIKSRRMIWAWYAAHMGEKSGVYRILMDKPKGKRPLGRLSCRWEDNIEMDLQ